MTPNFSLNIKDKSGQPYKVRVEFLGNAEGYLQFKVFGGTKVMILERPAGFRKWTIIFKNFDLQGPAWAELNTPLQDIYEQLNEWAERYMEKDLQNRARKG